MSSFFSSDGSFPLQFAIIFVVIFLVLAAGVFLVRRLGGKGSPLSGKNTPRGRQPRLGIVDIYELDRQRQLILLRRDNVEHLLLVGGPNDVVIERNILRGMSARLAAEEAHLDEAPEPALNPMPEPPVTQQASMPSLAAMAPPVPSYREPSFEMPVTVAPVVEVAAAPPEVARGRGAVPEPGPSLTVPDPAVPPRQRDSQLARVMRRTPPTLANLVPAAIAERVGLPERGSEAEPARDPQSTTAPPPVVPAPAARAIDAAILSDMARQLEEALRRPSAAVRPAATDRSAAGEPDLPPAAPQSSGQVEPETQPEPSRETLAGAPDVDPMAAAMAATAQPPASEAHPVEPEPATDDALFAERSEIRDVDADVASAEPPVPPASAPVAPPPIFRASLADAAKAEATAPPEAPPAAIEPPPVVPPAPPPSSPTPAKAPAIPNPFSVEEIEAEFARLLGRPLDRKQ